MNILYAKSILYLYKDVDKLIDQIDELVEKKALSSMYDLSPCQDICESILNLTEQKDAIITLKLKTEDALSKFTDEDLIYLEYKYFRKADKERYKNLDYTSRAYFRKQIKLVEKFALRLEKKGVNDEWFNKNCLSINFFVELVRKVKEIEELAYKNKPKREESKTENELKRKEEVA